MQSKKMSTTHDIVSRAPGGVSTRSDQEGDKGGLSHGSPLLSSPSLSSSGQVSLQGYPFFTSLFKKLPVDEPESEKRVLWFTDTLNDLNGPSVTLKKLGWLCFSRGLNLHVVSALLDQEITPEIPPNFVNLPFLCSFRLPYYNKYIIKVPAFLRSLRIVKKLNPTDIYISTPGTVGIFAMLAAKILKVRTVGIYHTDFYAQSKLLLKSRILPPMIKWAVRWFFSFMDEIQVPTMEYMDILQSRGYDRSKMKIFRRGLDTKLFSPRDSGKTVLMERFKIRDGVTLLFTGRISKDKNMDFLLEVYKHLSKKRKNLNLLIVGDGPYIDTLRQKTKHYRRVVITGGLEQALLPEIYSGADIFVFPSTTDTFGMAVLESQACGLPGVVSDMGGPKEIVLDRNTGYVARANDLQDWVQKIEHVIGLMENNFDAFLDLKEKARRNILENYDWETVLRELMLARGEEFILERRTHIA